MEEKIITPKSTPKTTAITLVKKGLYTLPLALPIMAIMYFDGHILAEVVIFGPAEPVNLYEEVPLPMSAVSYSLIVALIAAFTPFKRLSALAVGLAIGGIAFYILYQYEELKDMGLSSKPLMELLMEMVTLTDSGRCLIASIALCLLTQVIYAFAAPLIRFLKKRKQ